MFWKYPFCDKHVTEVYTDVLRVTNQIAESTDVKQQRVRRHLPVGSVFTTIAQRLVFSGLGLPCFVCFRFFIRVTGMRTPSWALGHPYWRRVSYKT